MLLNAWTDWKLWNLALYIWVSVSYGKSNVTSEYKAKGIIKHALYWIWIIMRHSSVYQKYTWWHYFNSSREFEWDRTDQNQSGLKK